LQSNEFNIQFILQFLHIYTKDASNPPATPIDKTNSATTPRRTPSRSAKKGMDNLLNLEKIEKKPKGH